MKPFRTFCFIQGIVLLSSGCSGEKEAQTIQVIPEPVFTEYRDGSFSLDGRARIHAADDEKIISLVPFLKEAISSGTGYSCKTDNKTGSKKGITLELDPGNSYRDGEYLLEITPGRILIRAGTPEGLFHGIQTFRQLLPPLPDGSVILPAVLIKDYPRLKWRGMHLDVSRHFFDIDFIKEYIDLIAMHKMNVFHWHLVDDQGWRIEIEKYPLLTETGAWRVDREDQPWNSRDPQKPGEKATYGGFYTKDQIREIVSYAAERFVTVVPEIEMPAHVSSALAAYPEYSCTGGPFTVPPGGVWPITDIYCAGKDATFEFIENILDEVMELFPSEYIHIGGDEADKTEWKKCPDCQARIKSEGLKDEAELQSYFVKRIEKYLSSHGRRLIGWDEILEGGLATGAAVMSWRGMEGGRQAAGSGHFVVMCPGDYCYFDHYQADPETEPKAIGGFTPLKKVYSFNPVPGGLTEEESGYILGAQANLWTEYITTPSHAEYMVLPRMAALAEVLWSDPGSRNWERFSNNVKRLMERYEAMGLNYSRSTMAVDGED